MANITIPINLSVGDYFTDDNKIYRITGIIDAPNSKYVYEQVSNVGNIERYSTVASGDYPINSRLERIPRNTPIEISFVEEGGGFLGWGGTATLIRSDGNTSSISFPNNSLVSFPDSGIFDYRCWRDDSNNTFLKELVEVSHLKGVSDFTSLPSSLVRKAGDLIKMSADGTVNGKATEAGEYVMLTGDKYSADGYTPIKEMIGSTKEEFIIHLTDPKEDVLVESDLGHFVIPFGFNLTHYQIFAQTAPVGADITIDIKDDGVTITTGTLSDGSTKGFQIAQASTIASESVMTFDITQVGSTIKGQGIGVILLGTRI